MKPNSSSQSPNYPISQLPNNPKLVFFGSSKYVIPILEVLRKNFDLKLVLTTEKNPTDAVPAYCLKNKIKYTSVSNLSDPTINYQLSTINSKVAVLADFGLIIPQSILNVFSMGIINVHPSLLPKYRGPTPVQTAILNEEKITGVTIIKLDEEIDHGHILGQEKERILDTDTAESLYKRLFEKGANLLSKILNSYLKGNLKLNAQNHKEATLTKQLTRKDGFINPNNPINPKTLNQIIKAYSPWPGVWFKTKLRGAEKIIKLLPNNLKSQYPNDPFLIQVEGKKPMSYKDFLNGYQEAKNVHSLVDQL